MSYEKTSTNSATAPVPSRGDQPGVGRAANPSRDDRFGPTPTRPASRKMTAAERRVARREAAREQE